MTERAPAWEAAFLIGIFPEDAPIRWSKLHVFSGPRTPGRHCLSAVEGMDTEPETMLIEASAEGLRLERTRVERDQMELHLDDGPWVARAPGVEWTGELFRELTLRADGVEAVMRPNPSDVLTWARFGGLLSYWSAFCPLTWNGVRGLGLVERARGAQTHLDVARVARTAWRWDVFVTSDLRHFAAELRVGLLGRLRPIRAGGRLPGMDRLQTARSLARLGLGAKARAATDEAPVLDAGGFVGLAWDGATRDGTPLWGTGFREHARD